MPAASLLDEEYPDGWVAGGCMMPSPAPEFECAACGRYFELGDEPEA